MTILASFLDAPLAPSIACIVVFAIVMVLMLRGGSRVDGHSADEIDERHRREQAARAAWSEYFEGR